MNKTLALFMVLSMSVVASPVFAQGGHGSHGSTEHGTPQAPKDDQNAEETKILLSKCAQYVGRIQQRIQKLQMEIEGVKVGATVRDELKELEQILKEANVITRSLQIL